MGDYLEPDEGGFLPYEYGPSDVVAAKVSYGPKLHRPSLLLLPQEIHTQHFEAFIWELMDRTDVTFEVLLLNFDVILP